jgi:hypothetical protein
MVDRNGLMRDPRTDGADSDTDKVFGKAGKKSRALFSPAHFTALLYNIRLYFRQVGVSLGCRFNHTMHQWKVKKCFYEKSYSISLFLFIRSEK